MNSPQKDTVKDGGIKTLTSLPHIYAIVLMGLFTFVFLSVEYMFVNELSLLVSEQKATLSQNYVLGVSTAGFLLYPLLKHFLSRRLQHILMILAGLLSVFLTIFITFSKSFEYIFHGGIILFILLGLVGSNVYYVSACMIEKRHLAKTVGISYFFGILLQFINHNAIHIKTIQLIILSASMLMLFILLIWNEHIFNRYSWYNTSKDTTDNIIEKNTDNNVDKNIGKITDKKTDKNIIKGNKHYIPLFISIVALVMLMACLFSTLDSAVTLIHSDGSIDIGQGARILLPLSGLAAGFVLQLLSSDNNLLKIILILVLFVLVSIMSVIYTFEKYHFIQQFTKSTDEVTNEQDHCSTYLITKQQLAGNSTGSSEDASADASTDTSISPSTSALTENVAEAADNKVETPQTGDNSNIVLWLTLLIIICSSTTLYTFVVKSKKINR